MDDLIDREKLLEDFDKICEKRCSVPVPERAVVCGSCLLGDAKKIVEVFPHEESKIGRWEVVIDRGGGQMEDEWFGRIFRCNICGHEEMESDDIRFCAGCGAKMDGFGRDDNGAGGDLVDGA